MKYIIIALSLIYVNSFCYGQNTFPQTGKVGIGTLNPRSTLEISDTVGTLNISTRKQTEVMTNGEVVGSINFYKHYGIAYSGAIKLLQAGDANHYSQAHLAFYTTSGGDPYTTYPGERMRITSTGDVAIGTTDSKGYKLAVNGKIRTQEIKVENSSWPDYVFEKSYQLPTLRETENHIKAKGHLPGIPSAAEVKANGIDLGDMNAKLLQKIEELTLHLIEMKRENEMINQKFERQQEEINKLKSTNSNR